jgi:MFS family permease
MFGIDISSMSAWIGSDQYLRYFHSPGSTRQGGITASMSAGSFAGALGAGFLSDRMGRRGVLKVSSLIWVVGAVLQCSSQNVAHLVVGRVVSGVASTCLPAGPSRVELQLTESHQQSVSLPRKSASTWPNSHRARSAAESSASSSGPSSGASLSCISSRTAARI